MVSIFSELEQTTNSYHSLKYLNIPFVGYFSILVGLTEVTLRTSGAAVAQWLRRRLHPTQQTWVQLSLMPIRVIGGDKKCIHSGKNGYGAPVKVILW